MRLKFDANQEYQIDAVQSIAEVFRGQARVEAAMQFKTGSMTLAAVANRLDLDDSAILLNVRDIQDRNRISNDDGLKYIEETIETADGLRLARFLNLSVEMETGTGKTYVYLRTALELFKRYGFRKYVIVVPSVAIREGVLKTLRVTEDHFRRLFDNMVFRYYEYDSATLTQIRQFALSDSVELMIMTIDAFNKSENVIRRATDRLQGETPIQLLQEARPILILDEPQNMESGKSIAALAMLNPLLTLRYSATHRNPYNLVYRLTPAAAYDKGLVKKIEVHSVLQDGETNIPYIKLLDIATGKRASSVKARVVIHKLQASGRVKETAVSVKPGDTLAEIANRPDYADLTIAEINPAGQFIRFTNELEIRVGGEQGADRRAIFAAQIRHTVEEHFRKQRRLKERGIKVLSLFFIDRVVNYIGDETGTGVIRELFDSAFNDVKQRFAEWRDVEPGDVQVAYFAERRRRDGALEALDSSGDAKEDLAAYNLIMRDKETLLSFPADGDNKATKASKVVSFIFSHSALREGWDNPNVFQICTLNQTASPTRKRQEVGRGVRLAVNQNGDRVHDEQVNILTVVANESYRKYVETLQSEIAYEYRSEIESRFGKPITHLNDDERRRIEEEYGEGILPPPPRRAGDRVSKLRKARLLSADFQELWERIKPRTRYSVTVDSGALVLAVLPELARISVTPPRITVTRAQVNVSQKTFGATQIDATRLVEELASSGPIPNIVDLMSDLLENTSPPIRLTRRTLLKLFASSESRSDALKSPFEWAMRAAGIIKDKLADHLVEGIRYQKSGEWYDMQRILNEEQIDVFSKYVFQASNAKDKTIYDVIPCDSNIERSFAQALEARDDVRLYVKLPFWFTVPTPVGEYRPDWAVFMAEEERDSKATLYLVAETKGSPAQGKLRPDEWRKIQCGAAHFGSKQYKKTGALQGVDYKAVTNAAELP